MTQAAMRASDKDLKSSINGLGLRGDFIEVDANSLTRPLPVVRIDGPYGAPAEDVFKSEVAVLIGAGIGAVAFLD
jgi:NADPH oxidase